MWAAVLLFKGREKIEKKEKSDPRHAARLSARWGESKDVGPERRGRALPALPHAALREIGLGMAGENFEGGFEAAKGPFSSLQVLLRSRQHPQPGGPIIKIKNNF